MLLRYLKGLLISFIGLLLLTQPAWAFCGFYVAKADTELYNQASQVIIARDGDRTVVTMANDYQGDVDDFAMVVPVPVVLKEDQVHVGESKIIKRLDDFSAPRLVEYFDSNPCQVNAFDDFGGGWLRRESMNAPVPAMALESAADLGVTIEEEFSVGEYDILILSAKESDGLETWLRQNEYQLPDGASDLLKPYIRTQMKFFVAKMNLEEFDRTGVNELRPLMMAYESPKYMLPIRLGMMNANQAQDLLVYILSPKGQAEITNYRTVKIPSNVEVPEFVEDEFGDFYTTMFENDYQRQGRDDVFLEYAWDMSTCDPCSAPNLTKEELQSAGVFWDKDAFVPQVFITRLHVRYTRDKFPQDLKFHETSNRQSFQGRYVIRHPFRDKDGLTCDAATEYLSRTRRRQEEEVHTLAKLTGWDKSEIRRKVDFVDAPQATGDWWDSIW
ncbi:DUF2330 domain-containing protein [[Limnothrix rosea] IAM M-220]|uniref:DUF2330 domain-containing protein n=1 Tax=[Limnothrix rosea] IAM M-220 TaxID=454133 RepID=UPI000969D00B|nr:DUF2330 domain-containing protein [[Limnothrix rosea] IAM M-220]OKH19342.1 hypothetical protein NIES208_02155 [[Limnothrix rosea] IAM M-220]